jgi:hypothetical protein
MWTTRTRCPFKQLDAKDAKLPSEPRNKCWWRSFRAAFKVLPHPGAATSAWLTRNGGELSETLALAKRKIKPRMHRISLCRADLKGAQRPKEQLKQGECKTDCTKKIWLSHQCLVSSDLCPAANRTLRIIV